MGVKGKDTSATGYADGTKASASLLLLTPTDKGIQLLYAVLAALPLVLLRLIYAIVSLLLDLGGSGSDFTTSVAAKVVLSVVPEMIVAIVFVVAGIATRDMHRALPLRYGHSGIPLADRT